MKRKKENHRRIQGIYITAKEYVNMIFNQLGLPQLVRGQILAKSKDWLFLSPNVGYLFV